MLIPGWENTSFCRYYYRNAQRKHEQNGRKNMLFSRIIKARIPVISFRQDIKRPDHKHRWWHFSTLEPYYAKWIYIDFEELLTQKLAFSITFSSVLIHQASLCGAEFYFKSLRDKWFIKILSCKNIELISFHQIHQHWAILLLVWEKIYSETLFKENKN